MATSTDGSSEKLPNEEGSCSLLVNNLPSQWFNSDEISKINLLKPGGGKVVNVSCCKEENHSAIVRMIKDRDVDEIPHISFRGASSSVILSEKTSTMISLCDPHFCDLLVSTAEGLNIKLKCKHGSTYLCYGSLNDIVNFRNVLEKEILLSCGVNPSGADPEIDSTSLSTTIPSAMDRTTTVRGSDVELIVDQVHPDILIVMTTVEKIPGIIYDISGGSVYLQRKVQNKKSTQERFYQRYKRISQDKVKGRSYSIPPFVSLSSFQDDLHPLLSRHDRCGIRVEEDTRQVRVASSSSRQYDSITKHLNDILECPFFIFPNGRVLSLLKRDLTKESVDVIVNAANGQLHHIGGIAAAINKASHTAVQNYSDIYMSQRGNRDIGVGGVAVTGAGGDLLCQHVIHAVGPTNQHYDCRGVMGTLINRILNEAESLNAKSIAIPAISTGIFNVSKDLVAISIFSTILSYNFKKGRPVLDDIRIVIIDQPTYKSFLKHFNRIIEERNRSRAPKPLDGNTQATNPPYEAKSSSSEEIRSDVCVHSGGNKEVSSSGSSRGKGRHGRGGGAGGNDKRGGNRSSFDSTTTGKRKKSGEGDTHGKDGHDDDKDHSFPNRSSSATNDVHGSGCGEGHGDRNNGDSGLDRAHDHGKDRGSGTNNDHTKSHKDCMNEEKEKVKDCGTGNGKITTDTGEKYNDSEEAEISPEECGTGTENSLMNTLSSSVNSDTLNNPGAPNVDLAVAPLVPSTRPQNMPQEGTPPSVPLSDQERGHPTDKPPPGFPHGLHIPSSKGINPEAPPFSLIGVPAQCSSCSVMSNEFKKVFNCEHHYCDRCIGIMKTYYPCCSRCLPELTEFKRIQFFGATVDDEEITISDRSGQHKVIVLNYNILECHGSQSTMRHAGLALRTVLPATDDGRTVCMLFKRAFFRNLTFCLVPTQSGIAQPVLTHTYHKIFLDGDGTWGYPDQDYLQRVEKFLENSLRERSTC